MIDSTTAALSLNPSQILSSKPSEADRTHLGSLTPAELRTAASAAASTDLKETLRLAGLAAALERDGYTRLNDTYAGWGWRAVVIPTRTPTATQRRTRADLSAPELRELASWPGTDSARARSERELADALEEASYKRLADAPVGWTFDAVSRV